MSSFQGAQITCAALICSLRRVQALRSWIKWKICVAGLRLTYLASCCFSVCCNLSFALAPIEKMCTTILFRAGARVPNISPIIAHRQPMSTSRCSCDWGFSEVIRKGLPNWEETPWQMLTRWRKHTSNHGRGIPSILLKELKKVVGGRRGLSLVCFYLYLKEKRLREVWCVLESSSLCWIKHQWISWGYSLTLYT